MGYTTNLGLQSQTTRLVESARCWGLCCAQRDCHPLWCSVPGNLCAPPSPLTVLSITIRAPKEQDYKFELIPLHSPLLGESLLVSFPPLTDMLKFSGYSCLIWENGVSVGVRECGKDEGKMALAFYCSIHLTFQPSFHSRPHFLCCTVNNKQCSTCIMQRSLFTGSDINRFKDKTCAFVPCSLRGFLSYSDRHTEGCPSVQCAFKD